MERPRGKNGISKTGAYRSAQHTVSALFQEGWDDAAVTEVLKVIEDGADGMPLSHYQDFHAETAAAARMVGSALYTAMFDACELPAARKALLPIYQMGGYLDERGMLQLPGALQDKPASEAQAETLYRFDPELAPDGRFLELYSQAVVKGFPHGLSLELAAKPDSNTNDEALSDPGELAQAMELFCLAVKLAAVEKLLNA